MPDDTQLQNTVANYTKAVNDFNALRIRLDTQPLLEQIKDYLQGSRLYYEEDPITHQLTAKTLMIGTPKANAAGIQSILNWLSGVINPHVVQGNFPADKLGYSKMYEQYIYEFQVNLGNLLVLNCYNYDIDDDEAEGIIGFIMNLVVPFMSRLINNEERKSYNETMRTIESNVMRAKGGVPLFKQ